MPAQIENSDWLQWIERLVGASTVAAHPSERPPALAASRYYCHLDDQPAFLIPARLLQALDCKAPTDCKWIFNPQCSFETPDSIDLPDDSFACENPGHKMIWVAEPATRSATPYWLQADLASTLSGIQKQDVLPQSISDSMLWALRAAAIIVEDDRAQRTSKKWRGDAAVYGNHFRANGYVPLAQLIHPFHLAAMRRYYRYHLRRGDFRLGDSQSALRYVALNEPVATFFHRQLTARVSDIVGEPLKPSYCYFSSYAEGSILEKHVDREQCEFSVSMCIDYSPEPEGATPWPLRLHTAGGQALVFQALGDALLYRGREIPHSRSRLPAGHSSTSIFFHFVRQDFAGPLN